MLNIFDLNIRHLPEFEYCASTKGFINTYCARVYRFADTRVDNNRRRLYAFYNDEKNDVAFVHAEWNQRLV